MHRILSPSATRNSKRHSCLDRIVFGLPFESSELRGVEVCQLELGEKGDHRSSLSMSDRRPTLKWFVSGSAC